MAEKAIRLGGESTADAIVSAVDAMYTEHTFAEKDFALKHNEDEISVDTNFAAQNFWKEALIRFFNKKSAVLGLILIVVIVLLAVFGPGMNSYTYSGQDLSQKNFAPRVPGIERLGILDGSEKMSTTTGTKLTNAYQEKDKLDREFGSMITGSLNLHIQHNAEEIGQTIIDVGRAMQVAEKTLHMVDQTPQDFFRQRNVQPYLCA